MTDDLNALMEEHARSSSDSLEKIGKAVERWRDLSAEIADLEQRLEQARSSRSAVERNVLPELFSQAGVESVSVPASGNLPACEARLSDFYRANIPVSWAPQRREQAFRTLDHLGLSSLVRVTLRVSFDRESREEAEKVIRMLEQAGHSPEVDRQVHHSQLTSAVAELDRSGRRPSLSDLDSIGADVGKIVKVRFKTA